ncbi:MAG: permease, partial [Candidatus Adiutricales bacterium]
MNLLFDILTATSELLEEASIYILFGIFVGGLLKVFLNPGTVSSHLGQGRFSSVFKAAFLGIPIPLCSCGVLPAAASLKRQGANNGATTAFLISTPESGVDSIAITYALLDPIMTVVRPVAAFITATAAGILENLLGSQDTKEQNPPDLTCTIDNCCDGLDCLPEEHIRHHTFNEKIRAGVSFAFGELWSDLVGWCFVGIFLAGAITVLVPPEIMMR